MKSNSPTLKVIILIIFCGIGAFACSLLHINSFLNVREDTIEMFLSDSTHYKEGFHGEKDTLMVGNQEAFRAYIRYLDSIPDIHLLDTANQPPHKRIFEVHLAPDSLQTDPKTSHFFKRSAYLLNRLYFSSDSVLLYGTIEKRDLGYKKKFAEVDLESAYFLNRHPSLIIWMLMMSIVVGFSFCLAPLFIAGINEHGKGVPRRVKTTAFVSAIGIIMVLIAPALIAEVIDKVYLIKPTDIAELFGVGFTGTNLMIQSNLPFIGPLCWLILVFIICYRVTQLEGFGEEGP